MKSIYITHKDKIALIILLLAFSISGCKKFINLDPPETKVTAASVYSNNATASAVLTGLYSQMSQINYGYTPNMTNIAMWTGLSADEFILWSGGTTGQMAFYKNALSVSAGGFEFWNNIYPMIFTCNSAIEGLNVSTDLTAAIKQQLLGEAKFMRALFYFYLVNLYGDLPLALTTDYTVNVVLARSPKAQVYQQIINDLKDAQSLLSSNYLKADVLTTTTERVRPTKWAATALLARAYLYSGDYVNAEAQATAIINNSSFYSLTTLNNVFLKNSTEAIWQLQPVTNGTITNTADAVTFNLSFAPTGLNSTHPIFLSSSVFNAFEIGDNRKTSWTNSYTDASGTYNYVYKYKVNTTGTGAPLEYTMVLRLAEQYLIRAEARAQQNNVSGSQSDLNVIRARAGLGNTAANDKVSLLTAILHERQVELFTEWGHRWLDLKRTNTVDAVMGAICILKGGAWNTNWQLYPLPLGDIQKDPNLVQNSGY